MFPMVPFHALPKLHALIENDLPKPNASIFSAYAEMVKSLWRQFKDPYYTIRPELPPSARPYREEFHNLNIARAKAK
jgi:fatty acid desaturase